MLVFGIRSSQSETCSIARVFCEKFRGPATQCSDVVRVFTSTIRPASHGYPCELPEPYRGHEGNLRRDVAVKHAARPFHLKGRFLQVILSERFLARHRGSTALDDLIALRHSHTAIVDLKLPVPITS